MTRPVKPFHIVAETTPGMMPWEPMPGEYDDFNAAWNAARKHAWPNNYRVHVDDRDGNWFGTIDPVAGYEHPVLRDELK